MGAFDSVHRLLLVFGGNNAGTRADVRELWQYDLATNAWKTPPYLNGPLGRARGAFFGGSSVFLFSGIASLLNAPASMLTDFYVLDATATTPWTTQAGLGPMARFNAANTTRDGSLYVFAGGATGAGGQTVFGDLWRFDPSTSAWTRLSDGTDAPSGRLGASVVAR
jgi:N-acetylneuraminic acid mutarotase